jgi:biopolymer transport protein TolR
LERRDAMTIGATDESGRVMAAINVTPMADIMIVLLVIFMVITPLLEQDDVKLPIASNAADKKTGAVIVIAIRSDATISLDDDRIDNLGELALRLSERLDAQSQGGRRDVYVRADETLPYSIVWAVLQLCQEAGVGEIALLAQRRVRG